MGQKISHKRAHSKYLFQHGAAFAELAIAIVFLIVTLAWAMDAAQKVTELTWMSHSAYLVGISAAESTPDVRTSKMRAINDVIMNVVNSARFLPPMKGSEVSITKGGTAGIRAQVRGDTSMAWSQASSTLNANVYSPFFATSEGISDELAQPANANSVDCCGNSCGGDCPKSCVECGIGIGNGSDYYCYPTQECS